jgi:mannose-6-phosphate isomerase-like protein (cupin superfamily)
MAQLVKKNQTHTTSEHDVSTFIEYAMSSTQLSMGISAINGRYPASGTDVDTGLEQIWYVLDGDGTVTVGTDVYQLEAGDMLHIGKNEPYVIDGRLRLMVASTPAWTAEQHKHQGSVV